MWRLTTIIVISNYMSVCRLFYDSTKNIWLSRVVCRRDIDRAYNIFIIGSLLNVLQRIRSVFALFTNNNHVYVLQVVCTKKSSLTTHLSQALQSTRVIYIWHRHLILTKIKPSPLPAKVAARLFDRCDVITFFSPRDVATWDFVDTPTKPRSTREFPESSLRHWTPVHQQRGTSSIHH